jgi:hypothetical protein
MIVHRLFFVCLLAIFASSCATRQVQTLASLPLPADQSQNCCWQALQQLDITYGKQSYKLTGVLAQTRAGVTLVLLDPFGRRLLSVNKQGETITSYRSPELPQGLPERFLLASSILVWWPLADWQSLLASSNAGWKISLTGSERILSYRGQTMVRVSYLPDSSTLVNGMSSEAIGQVVILKHAHQPLAIKVITQSLDKLTEALQ